MYIFLNIICNYVIKILHIKTLSVSGGWNNRVIFQKTIDHIMNPLRFICVCIHGNFFDLLTMIKVYLLQAISESQRNLSV